MSCVLRVSGPSLGVCLASVSIKPFRMESDAAHFMVSQCGFDDFPGQIQDALAFLSTHTGDIALLMQSSGSIATLDFAIEVRGEGFQFLAFPAALVQPAGAMGIGLEISLYPAQI